ncbi:MAG: acyl-CoA dehydrogenase family protein [Dehalococcoidia bacterium]
MATEAPAAVNPWLDRVRELAPIVAQYRDQGEQQRSLPQAVFQAMREAQLFRMWVPRALGGAEVDIETMVQTVEELSRLDGSAGWNVMIAANTSILWAYLPHKAAAEMIAGDPDTVLAGTILAGSGTATPVSGGYRISGRWPFASGCHQADWLVAACTIPDDGIANPATGGSGRIHAFVVPIADCQILDTWYTTGLRGTGSHDFQVDGAFVPAARHFASLGATTHQPGPLYNTTITNVWGPNVAAVALGIARDALDTFVELAATKRRTRAQRVLAEQETIQAQVGEAEALLRSGRAFLYETIRDTWEALSTGHEISEEQAAVNRLATARSVLNAVQVVDITFMAAGSSSMYAGSRLDRCFRDAHMVTQHAVVGPANFALAGRWFLGLGLGARR